MGSNSEPRRCGVHNSLILHVPGAVSLVIEKDHGLRGQPQVKRVYGTLEARRAQLISNMIF